MRDDIWWASAHVLAILGHAVLGLAGAVCFVTISPFPKDGDGHFGDGFDNVMKFWLAAAMGMLGTILNASYYSRLLRLKRPTALEYPRELHHKRQVTLIGGVLVLALSCVGDLALTATHSAAYRRTGYTSFVTIIIIAILACSSSVAAFVADISKYYSQWRPDMIDAVYLEENQEREQGNEDSADGADFAPLESV